MVNALFDPIIAVSLQIYTAARPVQRCLQFTDMCFDSIKAQNMTVVRFSSVVARYVMIRHSRDIGNPYNTKR